MSESLQEVQNRINKRLSPAQVMTATITEQIKYNFQNELTFSPKLNHTSLKIAENKGPQLRAEIMSKAAKVASRLQEENSFTFQPKVSSASVKIAEKLSSDFMMRQQQHLDRQKKHAEQHKSSSQTSSRLSPVLKFRKNSQDNKSVSPYPELSMSPDEGHFGRLFNGPSSNSNAQYILKRQRTQMPHRRTKTTSEAILSDSDKEESMEEPEHIGHIRSKTMPPQSGNAVTRSKGSRKLTVLNLDRIKNAKAMAEKAMKHRKIFTIQGPYRNVRASLRRRGWVEKFYSTSPPKKSPRSKKKNPNASDDSDDDDIDDDDDDVDTDDDDEVNKVPPWEEEDGIYGIMSRIVRNSSPTFIWSVRREAIDSRSIRKEQMTNHYCKAGSFTTKVGLCVNMPNVPWFDTIHNEEFFPRCYRLSHDEDKAAFIDDFRFNACTSILKSVINCNEYGNDYYAPQSSITACDKEGKQLEATASQRCGDQSRPRSRTEASQDCSSSNEGNKNNSSSPKGTPRKQKKVPSRCMDIALQQCQRWLRMRDHEDLDQDFDPYELSGRVWEEFIQWYYQVVHYGANIDNAAARLSDCKHMMQRLQERCPQLHMDGERNIWIVKPGAKSRGRGIMCFNRLEEMLKLVSSTVIGKKDGKYVVQKYIERPLLIYNTKFDIRQWFLVTDWNPLTIWFYKDSYLRFCSQEFSLVKMDEAIHLSNNAIQCNYENGPRSNLLPPENMWTNDDFKNYLSGRGIDNIWDDVIYPGMKRAVQCALMATQDLIEYRKSSFELYGADFMLSDDFRPWLIEINSSPSMSASTAITTRMCAEVLDDTLKVVLDRKQDKNCDTGRFELAYKQPPVTVPPYIGINLCLEGQAVRKPGIYRKPVSTSYDNSNSHDATDGDSPGDAPHRPTEGASSRSLPSFRGSLAAKNINQPQIAAKSSSNTSVHTGLNRPKLKMTTAATTSIPIENKDGGSPKATPTANSSQSMGSIRQPSLRPTLYTSQNNINAKSIPLNATANHTPYAATHLPIKISSNPEQFPSPKTIPSPRGSIIGTDGSFSKTCVMCGNGMNLRLSVDNSGCDCRRDGIRFDLAQERSRSAGRLRVRLQSPNKLSSNEQLKILSRKKTPSKPPASQPMKAKLSRPADTARQSVVMDAHIQLTPDADISGTVRCVSVVTPNFDSQTESTHIDKSTPLPVESCEELPSHSVMPKSFCIDLDRFASTSHKIDARHRVIANVYKRDFDSCAKLGKAKLRYTDAFSPSVPMHPVNRPLPVLPPGRNIALQTKIDTAIRVNFDAIELQKHIQSKNKEKCDRVALLNCQSIGH